MITTIVSLTTILIYIEHYKGKLVCSCNSILLKAVDYLGSSPIQKVVSVLFLTVSVVPMIVCLILWIYIGVYVESQRGKLVMVILQCIAV